MTPTWPKSFAAIFAIPAIGLIAFALAACSSGPPSAEEIIARSRDAMSQLAAYQWNSTHNMIRDGRFGAPPVSEIQTYSGAWRSDDRSVMYWLGTDGQPTEFGISRSYFQIGDSAYFRFANGEIFATSPGGIEAFDASSIGFAEDGRHWSKGPDTEMDGQRMFTIESMTDEDTEPRWGDPAGPAGHRTTSTVYFVDSESFIIVRKSEQIRSETPVLGFSGTELVTSLRFVNTTYFAFNEPVEIEFPEGFEPGAAP